MVIIFMISAPDVVFGGLFARLLAIYRLFVVRPLLA